jgi:hypothetical protein
MSEPIEDWRVAAEQALSAHWGAAVTCELAATLREQGRNRVFRLAVRGGPADSVIVKACVGHEGSPYVRGDPDPTGAFQRFCNECAGAAMLGPLGLGPRLYTGDVERGFCIEEDLGDGETLAARLTGDDPAAAEAALFAYARSLADMHRATQGMADRWRALLAERGAAADQGGHLMTTPWRFAAPACMAVADELGFAPPPRLEADLATICDALDDPGDYLAFTPTDCCPDNHYLRGERVVFFDCEGAQMRHALIDAAYFLAPFPTCWCCAALPGDLPERLVAAYREGFPGSADFEDQLTMALAAWFTTGLAFGRIDPKGLDADSEWGLSTVRQRRLEVIRSLLARPGLARLLPGVADFAAELDQRFRARWPDAQPMQVYPAFA